MLFIRKHNNWLTLLLVFLFMGEMSQAFPVDKGEGADRVVNILIKANSVIPGNISFSYSDKTQQSPSFYPVKVLFHLTSSLSEIDVHPPFNIINQCKNAKQNITGTSLLAFICKLTI